jgi:molybdopterin synthase sulfur carrier subunit
VKITYSAWLKDTVGIDEEIVALPDDVTNVGMLIDWLGSRGPAHARAFEFIEVVKVAVNKVYVDNDYAVTDDDEVILFPPIAGG